MVARKLVPKCVNIDDTFSEYNDEDDEDILGLRAAEGDFNIPVCEQLSLGSPIPSPKT